MIDDLVVLARDENDNATENLLQWFVAEQVEEEATTQDILDKPELVGDDGPARLMMDQEPGQRGGGSGVDGGLGESAPGESPAERNRSAASRSRRPPSAKRARGRTMRW